MKRINTCTGTTLIELTAVLLLLGILAAIALPKFADLSSAAKVASLRNIERTMKSTINLVLAQALIQGLSRADANPGTSQSDYVIDLGSKGSAEIDWRNLCPESIAELGTKLTMVDFINLGTTADLSTQINNRWTLIGYDIPGFNVPTDQGCYLAYDSFGDPSCTITVVTVDC